MESNFELIRQDLVYTEYIFRENHAQPHTQNNNSDRALEETVNSMCRFSPSSLFNTVLSFVASHVLDIVSLCGLPEYIGHKIFQTVVNSNKFKSTAIGEEAIVDIIKLFITAYKQEILQSLNLTNSLLMINEYLNPLLEISTYLCELDLRHCDLGDNHEFIRHIGKIERLERLCLMHNCLSDEGIRNLTLPFRITGKGSSSLQELDISYNSSITIKVMPWLSKFMKLKALNISSTGLIPFLQVIESKYRFSYKPSAPVFKTIKNNGWASFLINEWIYNTSQHKYSKIPLSKTLPLFPRFYKRRKVERDENCKTDTEEQPIILIRS